MQRLLTAKLIRVWYIISGTGQAISGNLDTHLFQDGTKIMYFISPIPETRNSVLCIS